MSDNQLEDYNLDNKEEVNKARKKAARLHQANLDFVKAAMSHYQGRSWFYNILLEGHIFNNPFMGEETHNTAFKLGEQNYSKKILSWIMEAAPDQYLIMLKENQGKE